MTSKPIPPDERAMNDEEAIAELKAYLKRNGDAGVEVLVEQLRKLKAFELQSLRSRQPDREAVIEERKSIDEK